MTFSPRTILIAFVALILSHAEISRAGWVLNDKLTAYPAIAKEKFGCSVATDGNWLAVGATDTLVGRFRATGAVHIFERVGDNWFFRQTLFNPTPASFQAFGNSIALRQDHLGLLNLIGLQLVDRRRSYYSCYMYIFIEKRLNLQKKH